MKIMVQRDDNSCGPVALRNAIVLLGGTPPPMNILKTLCRHKTQSPGKGTYPRYLKSAARQLGFEFVEAKKRAGHAVYVEMVGTTGGGHFVAWSKHGIHNAYFRKRYVKTSKTFRYEFRGKLWKVEPLDIIRVSKL